MKNLLFGILAFVALLAYTYDASSTDDQGQSTELGINKTKIKKAI